MVKKTDVEEAKAAEEARAAEEAGIAGAVQKFTAVHVVVAGSGVAQPGETISLTREEYDGVKPYGSIEGEWKEKAAGKKPPVAE